MRRELDEKTTLNNRLPFELDETKTQLPTVTDTQTKLETTKAALVIMARERHTVDVDYLGSVERLVLRND